MIESQSGHWENQAEETRKPYQFGAEGEPKTYAVQ